MSLTRQDVEKVALARLKFNEDGLDKMTDHMVQIIQYVDKLSELDTEDVQPMAHALDIYNALPKMNSPQSVPRRWLKNAPKRMKSVSCSAVLYNARPDVFASGKTNWQVNYMSIIQKQQLNNSPC